MNYLVYKITNQINGKIYIGVHKTTNVDDDYMGSGKLIKAAIKKYGVENFKKEILAQFESADEMFNEEKNLISQLSPEYNLHPGGNGGWEYINKNKLAPGWKYVNTNGLHNRSLGGRNNLGRKNSLESRLRMSAAQRKSPSFLGKQHTDETKKKIGQKNSLNQAGANNSQFGTMWITNGQDSKKVSSRDEIPPNWRQGRIILSKNKQE